MPITRRLPDILALCALLLAPCLLLWRVVFAGDVFLPADLLKDIAPWAKVNAPPYTPWNPLHWDGMAEFYTWRFFAAQAERAGFLPLWNPHQFCGTPFLANAQSAVLYPPNALFALMPVPKAFGASIIFHLCLTGAFLYAFLRWGTLKLSRAASLTGALCWQLSAWQVAWLALPTFLCTSAWLPLALLLTERAARKPTAGRGAALGAVLGITLLAGHLQIAFYCIALVVAYAAWCVAREVKTNNAKLPAFTLAATVAVLVMIGLALPQLLPSVELSRVSHRAGGHATPEGYGGYVKLAVPAINLTTLWLPQFFGNPTQGTYWGLGTNGGPGAYMENAASVGALALFLALAGVVGTWRSSPQTRFFTVTALIALLLALGTPLNALLYFGVPGWSQSGSPGRVLVIWTLCASVLAAVGVESLLAVQKAARPALLWTVLLGASLACTFIWVTRNAPAGALAANLANVGDWWRAPAGVCLAGGAVLVLLQRKSLTANGAGFALSVLVAAELLASGVGFNRTAQAKDVYPVTPAIAFLQQHASEGRVMPVNSRWSLDGARPPRAVLPPNAATAYGLYDTQGYDSLLLGQYFGWAAQLNNGPPAPPENGNLVFTNGINSPLATDAGVRFVVSRGPLQTKMPLVAQDGETFVYQAEGKTALAYDGPNRVETQSTAKDTPVAVQFAPGWRAFADGKPATVTRERGVFCTVHTPNAASHAVTLRYEPNSFRLGGYALCVTLAGLAALAAFTLSCRRHRVRF